MARYIDVEVFIYNICRMGIKALGEFKVCDVKRVADETPTADVVEVVHGEWIDLDFGTVECSVCGLQQVEFFDCENQCWDKFCKKCGAKMDLECDT